MVWATPAQWIQGMSGGKPPTSWGFPQLGRPQMRGANTRVWETFPCHRASPALRGAKTGMVETPSGMWPPWMRRPHLRGTKTGAGGFVPPLGQRQRLTMGRAVHQVWPGGRKSPHEIGLLPAEQSPAWGGTGTGEKGLCSSPSLQSGDSRLLQAAALRCPP